MNRVLLLSLVGGMIVLVAVLAAQRRFASSAKAHEQLLAFRQLASIVDTNAELEERLVASQLDRLKLVKINSQRWIVLTPSEFGASNWHLHIEFDGARIAALRIRLADDETIRPRDAPPDVIRR